jgi:hypothetical protein
MDWTKQMSTLLLWDTRAEVPVGGNIIVNVSEQIVVWEGEFLYHVFLFLLRIQWQACKARLWRIFGILIWDPKQRIFLIRPA